MGIPDSQRVGIWISDADVNIGEGKMLYDPLEDDERLMGCYFRPELKTTNSAPPDEHRRGQRANGPPGRWHDILATLETGEVDRALRPRKSKAQGRRGPMAC